MKYDPRGKSGKPGMVIMIGVKGKKKDKEEKKKYGSMPMKKAWETLKALPEHQMFSPAYQRSNLAEDTYEGEGVDVGERQEGMGTIHPAIYSMMQRHMRENPNRTSGAYNDGEQHLPNLNLDAMRNARKRLPRFFSDDDTRQYFEEKETPMIDMHPEYYADSMPYGSTDDPTNQYDAYQNPDNKRRTQAPQTYSYQKTHPTNKEVRDFREDYSPAFQNALRDTTLGRRAAQLEE